MILIEIILKDGLLYSIRSSGHSSIDRGYKGSNPVCAGVSTLIQTMFIYLRKHKLIERFTQGDGFFFFELAEIRNPKKTVMVDNAYKMVTLGLEEIARQYPEEVKLDCMEHALNEARRVS